MLPPTPRSIKIKEQFVALVSHEIRTPLNAMSGAAALLAGTSPLNDEQRSLISLLDAAADNVIAIIDDILQASALSSGHFPVLREPLVLISDVVEPAWRMIMLQPARRDKLERLRLSRHVAADVPDAIVGDAMRLVQVITNLLSNSCKFTPEGGALELRVDVAGPPAARWLRFHVADTGIGIEPGACASPPASMPGWLRPAVVPRSQHAQDLSALCAGRVLHRARVRRHRPRPDGAPRHCRRRQSRTR